MHAWISYNPSRRVVWRGHETKLGVRRSIAQAAEWNEELRIFYSRQVHRDGSVEFIELPRADWETEFAK
jgi:hypothetical protein